MSIQTASVRPISARPASAKANALDRREHRLKHGLALALMTLGLAMAAVAATAQDVIRSHGYSYFGTLSYPEDFAHFDYVNPDAPKGGELAISSTGTFDSLNPYSRKGRSGVLTTLSYDQLIIATDDTVGEYYGLVAHSLEYDADRNYVTFFMRPEATFSDGTPVTAEDVVYSHTLFVTQGLPSYAQAVSRMVTGAEALDDHTVRFTFAPEISRRGLIETVGNTPIFSKAWFEADETRRLDEPRLEVAVGSGPYMLEEYDINRRITYTRRADYWGWDLPVNQGRHNYDRIRVEYFSDQTAEFEAFKAGEYTFTIESDPKQWATGYDFPDLRDGNVIKAELPNGSPANPTGFVFNLGREQLQDVRVREAIALTFNFEWTNESLRFGLFNNRSSFVQDTLIEARDTPQGAELALFESLGDIVPPEVISEPVRMSHTSDPASLNDRRNMRRASGLLDEAGWAVGDDGMRRKDGKTLQVQMPIPSNISPTVEGMHETFVQNLRAIGVDASFEKIDPSQYTLLRREREYDMLYSTRYGAFLSTGGGITQMSGSEDAAFSLFNPAGLASPFVDAVIEAGFDAATKEDTDVALMALDRALRHEFFVIPDGYIADHWVAYFDKYAHPDNLPPYALGYLDLWWVDPDRAQALRDAGVLR